MYEYKTEILKVGTKIFADNANAEDVAKLDVFLNERSKEGWELVTYNYMAMSWTFVVTFRRQIG